MTRGFLAAAAFASMLPAGAPAPALIDPAPIVYELKAEKLPEAVIPAEFYALTAREAAAAGVPLWIAGRMISAESGWQPNQIAENRDAEGRLLSRDLGLAQLNDRYLDDFAWRYNDGQAVDPFDPSTAVRVAMRYLGALYRATGTWEGAVASYNCGLTRYRTGRIPKLTQIHVARVFGADL